MKLVGGWQSLAFWRKWLGNKSERLAADHLRANGYTILVRNWRNSLGEVDLIARKGDTIIFVEVRSRSDETTEIAALSVDNAKQLKIARTALSFLRQCQLLDCMARFDVIAICWPRNSTAPILDHLEGAFDSPV